MIDEPEYGGLKMIRGLSSAPLTTWVNTTNKSEMEAFSLRRENFGLNSSFVAFSILATLKKGSIRDLFLRKYWDLG